MPNHNPKHDVPENSPIVGEFAANDPRLMSPDESTLLHSIGVAKRFSSRSAHDFNNIIAVIQGFAYILQGRLAADEENRSLAEQIETSACEALKLTAWLASFAGNNPVEMVELDLNYLVQELLTAEPEPQVELQLELGDDLPLVLCDEEQLARICSCLWRNAVEAMPDGGTARWETALECDDGQEGEGNSQYVRLSVSDTGEGIEESVKESIFEPFFTTKTGRKDRGLGLTMVYDAVHAHGGFMKVSSQPNFGTCVDVYLPVQLSNPGPSQEDSLSGEPQQIQRLMVVDDEEIIPLMVSEILKGDGVEVIGAGSGEDALKIYQDSAGGIKGVILDMTLPGIDGATTFKKLRELDPSVKVIISSGDPHQQAVRDVMAEGAFGMLAKPYSPPHLTEVVKQLFR